MRSGCLNVFDCQNSWIRPVRGPDCPDFQGAGRRGAAGRVCHGVSLRSASSAAEHRPLGVRRPVYRRCPSSHTPA